MNIVTPCHFPKIFDMAFLIYGISILLLFANFYLQSYMNNERRRRTVT